MPVSIITPRGPVQEREKEDPLDKIAKGLNIASQIFGIGVKYDELKRAQADQESQGRMQSQQFNKLREANSAEQRRQEGIYTQGEQVEMLNKYKQTPYVEGQAAPQDSLLAQSDTGKKFYLSHRPSEFTPYQKAQLGDKPREIATNLRKEYQGLQTTKDTATVSTQYEKVTKAVENPSAAGDLSLIFSYMKMLDPGSTVRESEFSNAQMAAGLPQQLQAKYNQVKTGERLTPSQRADFLNQAENLYKSQTTQQQQIDDQFSELSRNFNVDPKLVINPFKKDLSAKTAPKSMTREEKIKFLQGE